MKKRMYIILVIILVVLLVLAGIWIYLRLQVSYYDVEEAGREKAGYISINMAETNAIFDVSEDDDIIRDV